MLTLWNTYIEKIKKNYDSLKITEETKRLHEVYKKKGKIFYDKELEKADISY